MIASIKAPVTKYNYDHLSATSPFKKTEKSMQSWTIPNHVPTTSSFHSTCPKHLNSKPIKSPGQKLHQGYMHASLCDTACSDSPAQNQTHLW